MCVKVGVMIRLNDDGDFSAEQKSAIGKRMDQSIRMAKLTKSYVASELGVSRAAVTQYCQGSGIALPRLAAFCQITRASMDYIVFGTHPELESSLAPMIDEIIQKRRVVTDAKA